jgi:hypothetical protein
VGLELAFRLHRFWAGTGLAEGRYWLGRLLDDAPVGPWTAFAEFAAGYLSYWSGETEPARELLGLAASGLRGVDDGFAARALVFAAGIADDLDDPHAAMDDIREAIRLAEGSEDANVVITAAMGVASLLAERGDPSAVAFADRALEQCRATASVDQLHATLATAAMVAWQVGDLPAADRFRAEAAPVMTAGARIARVVLATASAGLELARGNATAAAKLVDVALADAIELGVDRELPLVHAVACRIALAEGRSSDAVDHAIGALDAVSQLSLVFPAAIALEAAATTVEELDDTAGSSRYVGVAARWRSVAAAVRAAGDRPAPVTLRSDAPRAAAFGDLSTPEALADARKELHALGIGRHLTR